MFDSQNNPFTSYSSIKSDIDKQSLLGNFFDSSTVDRILKEQKLKPCYSFYYSNRYDIKFLGTKAVVKTNKEEVVEVPGIGIKGDEDNLASDDKKQLRARINELNILVKNGKKEYSALIKELRPAEDLRMNVARSFRAKMKNNPNWDADSYLELKRARTTCDNIYNKLSSLNVRIKDAQHQMYSMNKKLHSQATISYQHDTLKIPEDVASNLSKGRTLIQGLDPGIVTTAAINCMKPQTLFESINRFEVLNNRSMDSPKHLPVKEVAFDFSAKSVDNAVLSHAHRLEREEKQRKSKRLNIKNLQKRATTRKIRLGRYYKKSISHDRDEAFRLQNVEKEYGSLLTFVGNWSGCSPFLRGHSRRSLKPIVERLAAVEGDHVFTIDEFRSTVTCNSCFQLTTKQVVRVGEEKKKKRVKGAVTCTNKNCPRRKTTRATTTNRDQNGAKNIALIGFSRMVSEDGLCLPPFRRKNKSNKYNLSQIYSVHQTGNTRISC